MIIYSTNLKKKNNIPVLKTLHKLPSRCTHDNYEMVDYLNAKLPKFVKRLLNLENGAMTQVIVGTPTAGIRREYRVRRWPNLDDDTRRIIFGNVQGGHHVQILHESKCRPSSCFGLGGVQ